MPQRADTPTQQRGLALAAGGQASPVLFGELVTFHASQPRQLCFAFFHLQQQTPVLLRQSERPSYTHGNKSQHMLLGLCCTAASYKHPGSQAGSAQPPHSICGLFSRALNLHARDRQTRAAAEMTDSRRPTPLPLGYKQGTNPSPSPLSGQGRQSQITSSSYCTVRFMT